MAKQKSFWSYQAGTETPRYDELPSGVFNGSRDDWESFSPGMRREIVRSANKEGAR